MFVYDKKLQYPVKIDKPNPRLAAIIISQYGGPDGELGASLRYLSQRYSMPFDELKGLLTDIGTEEPLCNSYNLKHSMNQLHICYLDILAQRNGIYKKFPRKAVYPPGDEKRFFNLVSGQKYTPSLLTVLHQNGNPDGQRSESAQGQ